MGCCPNRPERREGHGLAATAGRGTEGPAGKGIEVDSIYSKVYDLESFSYEPESRTGVEVFITKNSFLTIWM